MSNGLRGYNCVLAGTDVESLGIIDEALGCVAPAMNHHEYFLGLFQGYPGLGNGFIV
jgi:hypothetical protein